jgi:flagellar hook-length control protein FliK
MSQVLAAKAVPAVSSPARETLAAARKSDCFAAVFAQARKASQQEQDRSDRLEKLDRSRSRERSSRTGDDEGRAKTKASDAHARQASDAKPSRADRLQEAAEDAHADKASAEKSAEQAEQAKTEAKPTPAESEQAASESHEPAAEEAHEESNAYEFQPQPLDFTAGIQAFTPPSPATASATGPASGSPGSAGLPAGAAADVPGGTVPVSAPGAAGNVESASVAAGTIRTQASAAAPETAAESTATAGGRLKAATVEAQAKPAAGNDFQGLLGQAGRSRQLVQSVKTAGPSSTTPAEVPRQPMDMDSAAGPGDLARVLRSKVGARHSNMTIRLDPPELGQVRVDVRMRDEAMTVRFEAQTQAGHDALQGRLRELTGALEQQGVRVDSVEVAYRPPNDGQQDGQSGQQQQPSSGGQQWSESHFAGDGGQWQGQSQTFTFGDASANTASASIGAAALGAALTASGVDVVV